MLSLEMGTRRVKGQINLHVVVIQVYFREYDNSPSAYLVSRVAVRTQEIGTVGASCHSFLLSLATGAQNGHTLDG